MDDSNQHATGQRRSVGELNPAECFVKAFHASPYVQTVTSFDTGRYLYVNDRFVKAVGYAREEVIGKTSIELGLMIDKPDRTWLTQSLSQRGRVTRKKLRFRLRSGDVRIGLFNAEVIRLDGEDLILSTVSDITEQLAAEHRYHLQNKRVALVEEVVAALAHEVRNPLAGIKGVADAFLNRRKLTEQEREWMEAVRGEVLKIDARLRELLDLTQALGGQRMVQSRQEESSSVMDAKRRSGEMKRGRPQHHTSAPLGNMILKAMNVLGLTYKEIVVESERLARLHNNSDMRIGKSTLGNIISGTIRQPGTAKLDALRIILNLSPEQMDEALGLQPERRFAEQLELSRARTHEVSLETVTRHRKIKVPVPNDKANLEESQLLEAAVKQWTTIDVEYLSSFFPPHYCYVVVGEDDKNAAPVAPPGSRLLVNKLLNRIRPAENLSYHERELYYLMTPRGFTCAYLEHAPGDKIVLVPHPLSGNMREEFRRDEIRIIGQVIGVLYPR